MASPWRAAAPASAALMAIASAVPPVIAPIITGARASVPRKLVCSATASRSRPGRARWRRRIAVQPGRARVQDARPGGVPQMVGLAVCDHTRRTGATAGRR